MNYNEMEQLPAIIPIIFLLTTALTVWLLYRSSPKNVLVPIMAGFWLIIQAILTLSGFYLKVSGIPPRFALLIFPPILTILFLVLTKAGRKFMDNLNSGRMTLLHMVRIPVELVLFMLYAYHAVPRLMTFEGGNLDIISGLSAPLVWYWGYLKKTISRSWLIAWNILCMLLLFNIVTRAILSVPLDFQQLAFDQPNIALLHFPYSWLPAFVVPSVLLAHIVSLRQLLRENPAI